MRLLARLDIMMMKKADNDLLGITYRFKKTVSQRCLFLFIRNCLKFRILFNEIHRKNCPRQGRELFFLRSL